MKTQKNLEKKVELNAEKNEKIIETLNSNELISRPHNDLLLKTIKIKEYVLIFSKLNNQYKNIISKCANMSTSKLEELEMLLEKKNWIHNSLKNMSDFIDLETNSLNNYIAKNLEQNKMKNYSSPYVRDNTWID